MRERDIEAAHVERVKKAGGLSLKFKSPARKNVPDRIDLLGLQPAANALQKALMNYGVFLSDQRSLAAALATIAAAIQFTELKAPGKPPTGAQFREHARLRDLGFTVNVVDSK